MTVRPTDGPTGVKRMLGDGLRVLLTRRMSRTTSRLDEVDALRSGSRLLRRRFLLFAIFVKTAVTFTFTGDNKAVQESTQSTFAGALPPARPVLPVCCCVPRLRNNTVGRLGQLKMTSRLAFSCA